jgi:hypothetical protein
VRHKKGQSTGFAWIYALIVLFGLGILYIVFNQVFVAHLVPIVKGQVNDTYERGQIELSDVNEINGGIDKYMDFFHILPFVLFFIVIIFMIVAAIRKERESQYQ